MTLSRRHLEQGFMREIYGAATEPGHALTDEQLSNSLRQTLAAKPRGAGWWVFGYGSLLWNPIFPVAESRPAIVHGLHRRFCLRSVALRGTREQPGLVLGLLPGGSCRGVVYRLPAPAAIDELHLLWRREMVVGSYNPRWVRVVADGRALHALAFVVKRSHPQCACDLPIDEQARIIAIAKGAGGTSLDYLERTRVALVSHGVVDPYLETLAGKVAAICGQAQ